MLGESPYIQLACILYSLLVLELFEACTYSEILITLKISLQKYLSYVFNFPSIDAQSMKLFELLY